MNNYPSWWDQTITVYNRYEDASTHQVTWYRTVLTDCFWKYADEKLLIGSTKVEANYTVCRVPVNPKYKMKYAWDNLSSSEKANYFTFGPGDIIILGEVTDTVDEYTSGKRSTDLISKYKKLQGCMTVNYGIVNVGGGRGQEHYRVRGN